MKPKIAIADGNFGHHPASCADGFSASFFEWDRTGEAVSDTCFITDLLLQKVDKCRAKRKVAWLIEPRSINPRIYEWIEDNNHLYDFVLTFDKTLLDKGENFLYMPFIVSWIEPPDHIDGYRTPKAEAYHAKTNPVSMIASCKNMCAGHAFRQEVIEAVSSRVDHFGRGFKEIEKKEEGLYPYRFSIVLENTQDDYYFSEKIVDCFATGTIPIYWGGSGVGKHYDEEGIIRFDTLDELDDILSEIENGSAPSIYNNKYFGKITDNWRKCRKTENRIPEDWMWKNYPFLFT
tara:strand:- start:10841 stop:11710 length:870 start_codon:yes stop_codon:yes gene_type:complete